MVKGSITAVSAIKELNPIAPARRRRRLLRSIKKTLAAAALSVKEPAPVADIRRRRQASRDDVVPAPAAPAVVALCGGEDAVVADAAGKTFLPQQSIFPLWKDGFLPWHIYTFLVGLVFGNIALICKKVMLA